MTAAKRYAAALFSLAQQGKQQASVATAVAVLATALDDVAVAATLSNPRLLPAQRKLLAASMAKAIKAPPVLADTLGLMAHNNRLSAIPLMLLAYQNLNDDASGITHVKLASAVPLTGIQRDKLTEMLKKYTKTGGIRLEETLDPSLKGGFRAFFNGQVWDASLSGRLAGIATSLRNAVAQRQH